jgi:hypothetical protein
MMRSLRLATLTVMLLLLAPGAAHGQSRVRIVGGTATPITATPWQVGLLYAGTANTWDAQFCGGTIRDSTTVITAAHCVDGYPASAFDVLAGTGTLGNGSGQRIAVTDVQVDPAYDPGGGAGSNDAAMLKLASPIIPSSSAAALPLLTPGEATAIDSPADTFTASGWGSTVGYGPSGPTPPPSYPTGLRSVTIPFVSDASCGAAYGSDLVAATMLCAGETGKDSCQGDSGGPLAYNVAGSWKLAGIVSWGAGCAAAGYPGVYAEVAAPSVLNFLAGATPPAADEPVDDIDIEVDPDEDFDEPTIALIRKQCTRRTCSLLLSVDDPAPSAGIRRVTGVLRSKPKSCAAKKHASKKAKCETTRKVKVHAGGGEAYFLTLTKLKRGTHTVTITATDEADNSRTRRFKIKSR